MDVIGSGAVDAVPLVPTNSRLSEPGATADVTPVAVDFLPDLPAHRRTQPGQVLPLFFLPVNIAGLINDSRIQTHQKSRKIKNTFRIDSNLIRIDSKHIRIDSNLNCLG